MNFHPVQRLNQAVDWEAELIRKWFPPLNQMRMGVWCVNIGLFLMAIWPFISEPPLIYEMSAGALFVGGIGVVVTAVLAEKNEDVPLTEEKTP